MGRINALLGPAAHPIRHDQQILGRVKCIFTTPVSLLWMGDHVGSEVSLSVLMLEAEGGRRNYEIQEEKQRDEEEAHLNMTNYIMQSVVGQTGKHIWSSSELIWNGDW